MPINSFLWRGALETISFILASADPIGGTIITDWYSTEINENERCKIYLLLVLNLNSKPQSKNILPVLKIKIG